MAKQEKNKKISSGVGLENLTNDAIVANHNGNNSSSVSKNKPKKTFVKPESTLGLTVGNLKKFDSSNPGLAGAEFGFSALPKTTSTMAYYNLKGIAESISKIDRDATNRELNEKNLANAQSKKTKKINSYYDNDYAEQEVKNYKERLKSVNGDNNDGWLTKTYNGVNFFLENKLKSAIGYSGVGIGHVADIPDLLQKLKLPSVYDLNDLVLNTNSLYNNTSTFAQKKLNDLQAFFGGNKVYAKYKNDRLDREFNLKEKELNFKKLQNKKAGDKAIKAGIVDLQNQLFYESIGLGNLNKGIGIVNKVAEWVDREIFLDEDSSENILSNLSNKVIKADREIASQAQFEYDQEKADKQFADAYRKLNTKYGNNRELFAKEISKVEKEIYGKKRNHNLLSDNWEKDKRDFFTKLFDADSWNSVEDIADIDNRFTPLLGQAIGALVTAEVGLGVFRMGGSTLGATSRVISNATTETKLIKNANKILGEVSKVKPVQKFSELTSKLRQTPIVSKAFQITKEHYKAAPFSFAMAYDESQQIGHEVYEKVVKDKVEKVTGITKETFYKQYKPENGREFSPMEIAAMDKDYEDQIVKNLMETNPDEFNKIIKTANEASDLATTTNLIPATLSNMLIFGKFFNTSKMLSRATKRFVPFVEKASMNPVVKFGEQKIKDIVGEGILEEAGINMIAQKKGEFYANGLYYSIDDYKKEIGNKDWTENFLGGVLMGVPQSTVMSMTSGEMRNNLKTYKEYKKVLDDYKELSKYTGQDELSKYLATNLDAMNTEEFSKKTKEYQNTLTELEKQKKAAKFGSKEKSAIQTKINNLNKEFEKENNRFILTKINNAFQTGTAHKLISTLENMSKEDNISEEDKTQLLDTIDTVKKLELVYNKNIELKDGGKIVANRFTNIVNSKNLSKIDNEITQLETKKAEVFAREARAIAEAKSISERKNASKGIPSKGSFLYGQYAKNYTEALENIKSKYEEGDDFNSTDLRRLRELQEDKTNIQLALDKNEKEFENLTSEEYQSKVDSINDYSAEINKLVRQDLSEEKYNKAKNKLNNKYTNTLDRKDFQALENEAKIKYENSKVLLKEFEENQKILDAQQEKSRVEEEARKTLEATKRLEQSQKNGEVLSEEEKNNLNSKVPKKSVPEEIKSEQELDELEQRKVELATKPELTLEEQKELEDAELSSRKAETVKKLDNLLDSKNNFSENEMNVLSMLGINPDDINDSQIAVAENITTNPQESLALSSEDFGNDDNYSPNVLNEEEANKRSQEIKEFVEDLINTVAFKDKTEPSEVSAESVLNQLIDEVGRDKAEKAFNLLTYGYKLNNPDNTVDFGRLYNRYFSNKVEALDRLLDEFTIEEDESIEDKTIEELPNTSTEIKPKFDENNKPIVKIEQQETILEQAEDSPTQRTRNSKVKKSNVFLGSTFLANTLPNLFDTATLQFITKNFQNLDISQLFNWNNYKKYKSDKLPMEFRIPENYKDLIVKDELENFKELTFSEWEQKYNKTKGDPEWIAKVPIVAHFENIPVFRLNESYSSDPIKGINYWEIVPEDSPEINQAKKDYFTYLNNQVRENVLKNGSDNLLVKSNFIGVNITKKSRPLRDFSKEILIGSYDAKTNVFKYNGQPIATTNKEFTYFAKNRNRTVILKPVGVDTNGEVTYQAFQITDSGLLNKNHTSSISVAIMSYLTRNNPTLRNDVVSNFYNSLKEKANLDLDNFVDLSNYLNSIYKLSYFQELAKSNNLTAEEDIKKSFSDFMNAGIVEDSGSTKNNALPGQVSIAIVKNKICLAIKPEKTKDNPLGLVFSENIVIVDPFNIKDEQDLEYVKDILLKPLVKGINNNSTTTNISQSLLRSTDKYFLLNNTTGEIIEYNNYEDYARDIISIPPSAVGGQIPTSDGGLQDTPSKYVTLELTRENGFDKTLEDFVKDKNTKVVEDNKKEEVKKIIETQKETKEVSEEEINALLEKINKAEKVRETLVNTNISTEKIDGVLAKLRNDLSELKGSDTDNYSPNLMSEEQVEQMLKREKEFVNDIEGLTLYEKNDIVLNIFNELSKSIGYKKGAKISKKKILDDIRNKIFGIVDQNINNNLDTIETLKELMEFEEGLESTIESLEIKNVVLNNIKTNYNALESEVLDLLENKVGIKEVKDKSSSIIQDNDIQEEGESESDEISDTVVDKDIVDRDKDFNTSSLEVKGKATVSAKMKRFLAGIPIVNLKTKTTEKGFLGLTRYYDFKDLDDQIKVALNSPSEIDSDFEKVKAKLQSLKDQYSWALPLLEKLTNKSTPEQAKMEFMYNYTGRHSIKSKFVQFEVIKGKFYTELIDANFNDIVKNIRKDWIDNLKSNNSVYQQDVEGEYIASPTDAKRLFNEFLNLTKDSGVSNVTTIVDGDIARSPDDMNKIKNLPDGESITIQKAAIIEAGYKRIINTVNKLGPYVKLKINGSIYKVDINPDGSLTYTKPKIEKNTITKLSNWLVEVGLPLNAETLTDLVYNGLPLSNGEATLNFYNLLDFQNRKSPFSKVAENLGKIAKDFETLNKTYSLNDFNIFDGMNNSLLDLARVESKYSDKILTKNYKDNGKLMQGLPVGKYVTDRIKDLKSNNEGLLDTLSKISFSSNSLFLSLLRNPEFSKVFEIIHTANGSFKEKGGKFQDSAKVTDLTAMDLEVNKLAFFFENKNKPEYKVKSLKQFTGDKDTRIANIFLPTMSDKDQMMTLQTLVFNINEFNYKDGQLNDKMLELLYSQLVKPDLERIHKFHSMGGKTDIKNYDKAAQLFNLISSLNLMTDEKGNTITSLMKLDPSLYTTEYIEAKFKDDFKKELNNLINHLVDEKIKKWVDLEVIDSKGNIKINENYLDGKTKNRKDKEVLNKNLAAEFIINNLITNANLHMLVIGDPALYSQDKFFNKNKFEDGDPTKPLEPTVYREWSESSLGVNLGKRLALMLAPGNKIYDSNNDVYHQIYLKDFVDISSNILDLIEDFYSKEDRKKAEELLSEIKEINKSLSNPEITPEEYNMLFIAKKGILSELQESYNSLGDYFDIESTDAQEYTTISEHINIMRRQGRIDDEVFANISIKLKNQSEEAAKGLPISKENYLTKEELGQVLQPIKPVYTGQILDVGQDVARTVYVKSSSFPLIPQLTYGKEIDGVRRILEAYEAKINKGESKNKYPLRVRASYDTANKVGATTNAISPFNPDGTFNEKDFSIENIEKAKLELKRNNFRIQQDVPYKSDKGQEDRISYGTQMLKVLFSNGVLDIKDGFLNPEWKPEKENKDINKYVSGQELFDKYNQAFVNLVQIKKEQLYSELGLGKTGKVEDVVKFKENIAKLLEKEGKKRDYSKNDLNSLRLDENNNFILPLFLNNQSNKIESLLLSIISNRVIKHKFPGYSYVAGSEAGFKLKKVDNIDAVPGADRIIYTSDFKDSLKGTTHKDGKINFAQVMVPSKIRTNKGELLDLYSTDKNGEFKYITVDPETKRYMLKEEMIQEHLLNLVSFRIPTSSHVSLSNVKIVGILPPEAGDLILVPKNFTKQKGLDFDVDKENTYQLWTYINQNGKVKELSQGYIDYQIKKLQSIDQKKLDNLKNEDSEHYEELLTSLGTKEALEEFITNKQFSMEEKIENFKVSMTQKLIENEIIKIHSSVLGNSNKQVQNKINKILSMDFAKEQATNISKLKEIGRKNKFISSNIDADNSEQEVERDYYKNNRHFTLLSDDYQSYKMFLGSAGKSGIGVYSNFLTMSSLFQQYGNAGDFRLMEFDPAIEAHVPLRFNIAGIGEIDGILGRLRTLDNSRSISEVFEELQNTATDNEKEQIMGRTGINNHTISVFSIMAMLGIDKTSISPDIVKKYGLKITDNKMSFGNLLLSQNIVKEIVDKLEYNNSNLTDFDNKQVIDIIKDIKKRLVAEKNIKTTDSDEILYDEESGVILVNTQDNFDLLTGDNLVEMIASGEIENSNDFNYQVLSLLEKLYSYQDQFRNAQKILNISSNGLGLDLIENNNLNQLLRKVVNNKRLLGIQKLLFDNLNEIDLKKLSKDQRDKVVFVNEFSGGLVPTTPIGASILNAFTMSKNLWGSMFPYQNKTYRNAIEYALEQTNIKGNSKSKINFERKFAKEFKKYLNSRTVLFNGSVREERERLFFDTPDNTSLASYLNNLVGDNSGIKDITAKTLLNNPLIRKFKFDININNKKNIKNRYPSVIKYNDSNSIVENREILYRALPELIELNAILPLYNGKPYNTRMLAQDLATYAFLEGGIQEIQQFVKYIPITYLEAIGFTQDMLNKYNRYKEYLATDNNGVKVRPSFIRQFYQHNPDLVKKVKTISGISYEAAKAQGKIDIFKNDFIELDTITITDNNLAESDFISFYDPDIKGKSKYILFEKVPGTISKYKKLDSAGFINLSEYDSTKKEIFTLKKVTKPDLPNKPSNNSLQVENVEEIDTFGIGEKDTLTVVENLLQLDNNYTKVFEPFINFIPKDLKIEIGETSGTGKYSKIENKITINPSTVNKGSKFLSRILVKELIHATTNSYVSQFLNYDGSYINPNNVENVPLAVRKLKTLYDELFKLGLGVTTESTKKSLEDFLKGFDIKKSVDLEEFYKFYGFKDIHEFMEMSMTEPKFREFLDEISTKDSKEKGISFLDRLKDAFKGIWNNLTHNQVSKEVVESISEIILSNKENTEVSNQKKDEFETSEKVAINAKNLLDNNKNSNFTDENNSLQLEEDPFKC